MCKLISLVQIHSHRFCPWKQTICFLHRMHIKSFHSHPSISSSFLPHQKFIFFFIACKANQRCDYSLFWRCFARHSSGLISYFVNHWWCQMFKWQNITLIIYNHVQHPLTEFYLTHSTFSLISQTLCIYLFFHSEINHVFNTTWQLWGNSINQNQISKGKYKSD